MPCGLNHAIEWGKRPYGRNWHIITGPDEVLCTEESFPYVEVTRNQPPIRGRVCQRCAERAQEVVDAVKAAIKQESL